MNRTDITFESGGTRCAAWRYEAASDALTTAAGRPCVVMAHGLGGTRDSGLEPFAEEFAEAGADALLFDYRGFGSSDGVPRQHVDLSGQVADYHAAIAAARHLPGVDPDRIVIWGTSMSGGHVLGIAAQDHRLAAVIAMTPAPDGRASSRAAMQRSGARRVLRSVPFALRDVVAAVRKRPPVTIPLAGEPGEVAALTTPGARSAYEAIAGPTWQNAFAARALLRLGSYQPGKHAAEIACPVLVQIGDDDQTAPADAAQAAARRIPRGETRHYPCDHFDVYPGQPWHRTAVDHQLMFLTRHLAPADASADAR